MTEILIQLIEGSAINVWILSHGWLWPFSEILHFIGLSLLLGGMLIIDLRLMGFLRQMNVIATERLLPWASLGLLINFITGSLFFLGDPARYVINIGFQIKMLLVLIAGLNALWFAIKIKPVIATWEPFSDTPLSAKVIGLISLVAWLGVLLLGRLIPYVGTG